MTPFIYKTTINLRDTDATGVLYFADQFKIALETLEAFLIHSGMPLRDILDNQTFLLPIVHAEGDYFAPLMIGDEVEVAISITRVGTSSFTCSYDLTKHTLPVGKVSLVHVAVDKTTRTSIPLPAPLLHFLNVPAPVPLPD